MTGTTSFWTAWAPYWSYEEDFFLGIEIINQLAVDIISPVLIVGAGQGLLVEQLQKKGFKVDGIDLDPQMVIYAKKRRGLDIIQGDAKNMPFANNSYKTSVIASGVVDFINDEEQIQSIINETLRITDDSGKVFVAFYKYHPKVEKLLKLINLITDDGLHRFQKMYEMCRLSIDKPMECIKVIENEANIGFFHALLILVKSQMFLPKKEKRSNKRWAEAWKKATKELDNPKYLIDCAPEFLPYRNEEKIRKLFAQLNFNIHNMRVYDNCTIVQI